MSDTQKPEALYPAADPEKLGEYYLRHVDRMTVEGLHSKSDIAAQLALRDKKIDRLQAENEALRDLAASFSGYNLDDVCDALERCIESQAYRQSPFHQPVNSDAMIALRILKGIVPAMKALAAMKEKP